MDAASKCTSVGTDALITCIASFPVTLTTGPTVTWHKVDGSGDKLIEVRSLAVRQLGSLPAGNVILIGVLPDWVCLLY